MEVLSLKQVSREQSQDTVRIFLTVVKEKGIHVIKTRVHICNKKVEILLLRVRTNKW